MAHKANPAIRANPATRHVISINDLSDFARLFGASPSDFDGKIEVSGNVNAQERKLGGQLSASGNSLILFRAPIESLRVELSLKESRLEISELELLRKNDSFHGQASLDLTNDRGYSFTFTSSIADLADYVALVPEPLKTFRFGGSLDLNCAGHGTVASHSGTFHAWGHGLHPQGSPVIPFDAEFEGDYSPDNILFRQFGLSNPHAAFNALVTVAKDYLQLQKLRLDLNGKPKLQGNICLPLSLSKLPPPGNWLAALSDDPDFDLDVALDWRDLLQPVGHVLCSGAVCHDEAGLADPLHKRSHGRQHLAPAVRLGGTDVLDVVKHHQGSGLGI
jgi:hypothetical protein